MFLSANLSEEEKEEMLTKYFIMGLDITKFQMLNSFSKYAVTIVISIVCIIIFIIISNALAWRLSLVFEHLSKLMCFYSKCTCVGW